MEKSKFCCSIFLEALESVGQKGFSILPKKLSGEDDYFFVLQGRSKDLSEVFQQAIKYCPWCGTKLAEVIWINREVIKTLYENNKGALL
jgi:hypothetical protein